MDTTANALRQWASSTLNRSHSDIQFKAAEDMDADKARIAELESQLSEWRGFAASVGNPFRAKCGHIVNKGWRCLVCGQDPTGGDKDV